MGRANRDMLSNIFSRISSLGSPRKLSHGLNKNIEEISPGIKCWPSFFVVVVFQSVLRFVLECLKWTGS